VTCTECPAIYVGETWRNLGCRVKYNIRGLWKKRDTSNRLALHHTNTGHTIEWQGETCMEFTDDYKQQMFLENRFTKCSEKSINIWRDMPATYTLDWSHITVSARYFKLTRTQHVLAISPLIQDEFCKANWRTIFEDGFRIGNRNARQNKAIR
jgi:hypothetical protein